MSKNHKELTQVQKNLIQLFEKIEDKNIREVIKRVIPIESRNRSSSENQFPIREIRDVVETIAHRTDMDEEGE